MSWGTYETKSKNSNPAPTTQIRLRILNKTIHTLIRRRIRHRNRQTYLRAYQQPLQTHFASESVFTEGGGEEVRIGRAYGADVPESGVYIEDLKAFHVEF